MTYLQGDCSYRRAEEEEDPIFNVGRVPVLNARVTRYSISMLSAPISILSSYDHLPYRYSHLKVISMSILSCCHAVDRMTRSYLITLLKPPLPRGYLKAAAAPVPSAVTGLPLPATVVTVPTGVTFRMR
jgi:hypothetical protein